ncbi:MAG: carboxypeptidase-like regulatory domain-containing protein [Pyrinomonadaceae bacterium]
MVLLGCAASLSAQPKGACDPGFYTSAFDPLKTCNLSYISEEFVFLGRVISTDTKLTPVVGNPFGVLKMRVAVEKEIKGKPSQITEMFLDWRCRDSFENGEKRIFTARRETKSKLGGLVSHHWSTSLKDIPADELAKVLSEARFVAEGRKKSRIVGKVILFDSNPLGIYDFRGKTLDTRLAYNPQYSSPLRGAEITAKPLDENSNPIKRGSYKTKTNADGSYEFKDLPAGLYELSPTLQENLYVRAFTYTATNSEDLYNRRFDPILNAKIYVRVDNEICGQDIRFNVRPAGEINGRLIFENGVPSEEPFLRLLWVESETERDNLKWAVDYSFNINKSKFDLENALEFQYSELQVGKYILKIIFDFKDEQKNFYYPGVRQIKDAEIINIKAGETKNLLMKIY